MASIVRSALSKQAEPVSRSLAVSAPFRRAVGRSVFRTGACSKMAFHKTAKRDILPPLPQKIEGTVNDPAPVPDRSPTHGSYHWTFDRLIAAGLIPLTVAPFAAGSLNPTTDALLCALLVIHSHTGFQSIITDYLPMRRLPVVRKSAGWLLNIATALVGLGLYEFETNDVGVTETVRRVWMA